MRLLLDECLPRRFKHAITKHVVVTVPEMGWAGMRNGALLRAAADTFDVFVTVDQNLPYQQKMRDSRIIVAVLQAADTRLPSLLPLVPPLLAALDQATPGSVIVVAAP